MRVATILILCCLFTSPVYSAQWISLDSVLPDESFSDVYAIGNHVWITSGSSTELYYSNNGAISFTTYTTPDEFLTIHMLDTSIGYAGTQGGAVYKTSNSGENWTLLFPLFGTAVNSIIFPPSGAEPGYAVGQEGKIYTVTSTGISPMDDLVSALTSVSFPISSGLGWVCGTDIVYHYNGTEWVGQGGPSGTINGIFFIDNNNGWIAGSDGSGNAQISNTTNGGILWNLQSVPLISSSLFDVFFLNTSDGWAVGTNGKVVHTTNGGSTWALVNVGTTHDLQFLRSVYFVSQNNGYIVGNSNSAFKYSETLPPAPKAQVDKSNIYFGEVAIGTHKDEVITLSNTGTADLVVGAVAQANPVSLPFSIEVDNCSGQTLTPSSTCTITTRFTPTTHSDSSDTFDIPTNATPSTITISLNSGVKPFPWTMFMPACAKPK